MKTLSIIKPIRGALNHLAVAIAAGTWLAAGTALAAPANDDFTAAIALTGGGSGQTGAVASGTQTGTNSIGATLEGSEPSGSGGTNTVWFKWTCPANGELTVSTLGSTTSVPGEWDAVLGIYTGAAVGALTPLGTTPLDTVLEETMTVAVTAGTTYFIQTAGYNADVAANILLTWAHIPGPANNSFATAIALTGLGSGQSGTVTSGTQTGTNNIDATLQVGEPSGSGGTNTVWFKWTSPATGNLTVNTAGSTTSAPGEWDAVLGIYTGASVGALTALGSSPQDGDVPETMTVAVTAGATYFIQTAGWNADVAANILLTWTFVELVPGKLVLWNLAGGGDWDLSTENWFEQPSGPVTTFANNDEVTFNNAAGGTITIASGMSPLSTTVGGTGTYTFAGAPLAGGDLTVSAPGTLNISNGTYSSTISISGDGAIVRNLESGINQALNYDMSSFTGTLTVTTGMAGLNPFFSPSFVAPAGGTIRITNNTTAYLGWQGTTFDTTVELAGSVDNGEGLGLLRGDNATLNGAVVLAANSSIGSAGGTFTINAVISDGGNGFGFTTVGSGTVILTAATNTYGGPMTVNSGATLRCDNPGALGSGALSINGELNLNYVGTKAVASLTLGGALQTAPGTYGSVASLADFPDDTYFTTGSTGTVTVAAVIPTTTTTVLAAAGAATTYGENVTFTATVDPIPSGGTVQFLADGNYIGDPVAVNGSGEASVSTTTLGVGTHEITAEYSGYLNYETSTTVASISHEVGKAELTVTASNVVRTVNTANPDPLPYQITGYQNGEDLATSGVTGTPVLTTDATLSSPVGPYVITCAVGDLAADNYSFTPVAGTLTVTDLACQLGVLSLNANGGINPATGNPWALGDTYRLVLITSTTTQASSSDIATYNAFVQSVANASTAFPTLGSVNWKVVGSTATVDARDNTGTNPGSGTGVSIVRMDGTTIIANNNADLWDGISAPVNLDENGAFRLDDRVFTGTLPDGTKVTGAADQPLGSFGEGLGNIRVGYSEGTGGGWMTVFNHPHTEFSSVFAMSDVLTIVSTTPSNTFTTWAAANAGGQTASEDFDNDGVDNGIEYFMGQTGSSFTANPSLNASNVISWPASATYEGTYEVQTSPDLATWTNVDPRPLVVDGTLSYTLPTGLGKRFVRLLVTPTP